MSLISFPNIVAKEARDCQQTPRGHDAPSSADEAVRRPIPLLDSTWWRWSKTRKIEHHLPFSRAVDPFGDEGGIVGTGKGLEDRLEDLPGGTGWHRHANLLANLLLRAAELVILRKSLQRGPFGIRERARLAPVVDMRATTTRARQRPGRLGRVKATIDVAHSRTCAMETHLLDLRANLHRRPQRRNLRLVPGEIHLQIVEQLFIRWGRA